MKHVYLILLAAASLTLCGCNKTERALDSVQIRYNSNEYNTAQLEAIRFYALSRTAKLPAFR